MDSIIDFILEHFGDICLCIEVFLLHMFSKSDSAKVKARKKKLETTMQKNVEKLEKAQQEYEELEK